MKNFLILTLLSISYSSTFSQTVGEYVSKGDSLFNIEKYSLAIEEYSKAIKIDSSNYEIYLKRGKAYFNDKQNKKSLKDLNLVIKLNPQSIEGYFARSEVRSRLGNPEGSRNDRRKARELENKNVGETNFDLQDLEQVAPYFKDSLINLAGVELQGFSRMMGTSVLLSTSGALLATLGATVKSNSGNKSINPRPTFIFVGGILMVAGGIIAIIAPTRVGNAGRLLRLISGQMVTIPLQKTK
jgi:tetratricopeptide (TPR) repeat protein